MSEENRYVSEEMVKLIFLPIKETLSSTTSAINEASQQVKELARLFSSPPQRTDIISKIDDAVSESTDDLKDILEKHEIGCTSRNKDLIVGVIKAIEEHQDDMEKEMKQFSPSFDRLNNTIENNSELVKELTKQVTALNSSMTGINSSLDKGLKEVENRLSNMMWVVGIAFTLSMIVASVVIYFTTKSVEKADYSQPTPQVQQQPAPLKPKSEIDKLILPYEKEIV